MCYTIYLNTTSSPLCSQCNADLILISTITEHLEGSQFPQTSSTYHCSDQTCQDEKDRQTAIRVKLRTERDLATQKRLELRHVKKSIS